MAVTVQKRWLSFFGGLIALISSIVSRYMDDKFDYEPDELSVERQMEIHHDKITQGVNG